MREWLLWLIGRKEMVELQRWRVKHELYSRWLGIYPEVAIALDAIKRDVEDSGVDFIQNTRKRIDEARKVAVVNTRTVHHDEYDRRASEI